MDKNYKYDLSHCYLEIARGAIMQIHARVPVNTRDEDQKPSSDLLQAIFSITSISISYNYLSIEAFVNYQLSKP